MTPCFEHELVDTRRRFFGKAATGIGAAALASLLQGEGWAAPVAPRPRTGGLPGLPHFAPRAKRVVFLFQSGAPSQIDLFDYKPQLRKFHKQELPDSIRRGQRITGMTAGQDSFPVAASIFKFQRRGQSGAWLSELLPHTAGVVDDIALIKTMQTDAINHDPAITFINSGFQQPGRPSMGAWVSYGLGTANQDLPAFVVLVSQGSNKNAAQGIFSRLWGPGFLPSRYQGVKFRSSGDPVLYLSNPPGMEASTRRNIIDVTARINRMRAEEFGDPEIETRIAQYEMAYRMQTSVPELMDLGGEPESTFRLYGEDARKPGSYAANCLLARRLVERGVRFVQLYHRGWDQHTDLPREIRLLAGDTDRGSAALIHDLKNRGLLEDTLVVWGGEFGRTVYCQGKLSETNYGRDHHPRCFTMWMAGGGIKPGITYGETDDYSYNAVADPMHVYDLQATILHCLGVDHKKLTFKHQGRHFRLTDVHGEVAAPLLT